MSFTNPTTASTSVVLVPTATSNPPYYVYLNNVSTAGRIVTVRDNDGFASLTNQIIVAPINGAYFMDGTSTITINQPYGYITLNTALNGGYGILNTFGFPAGSAAAFVSNVTSCNFTTSTIGAQFISAPTGVFNIINTNVISTASILVNIFTPSTIAANSISTGSITGGSVSFQTIFGSSITTNSLALASLTATTANFTNVITSNATTSNLAFTGDIAISGTGSNVQIGSNTAVGSRGVAIGGNARAATDAVSLGFSAGSVNQGTMATSVGMFSGATNQGASAVAVGYSAGSNAQGANATSVGYLAGAIAQGVSAVALGDNAGYQNQGNAAIAIGAGTAMFSQGIGAISIGGGAGQNSQANGAISIGAGAGQFSQGASSIAIGVIAGQTNQHANTTIINASGSILNSATTNALYIAPIRDDPSGVGSRVAVYYNQITKEMTTGPATGTNLTVSSIVTNTILTNSLSTNQLVASTIQTNTISTSLITGTGISSLSISTGTTLTGTLQTNTLSSGTASFGLGNVSTINTNSISTASLNVGALNVNSLSTGSISLATASISSLATNAISSGTITINSGTISTFTAGSIVANTERVGSLSTNFISANIVNITGPTSMINARTQSVFVVNGNDTSTDLKYSLDGITWCNSVANGGFSGSGSKVAWNGSLFVAVGSDTVSTNTIKYSSDGSNWFNSFPGGFTTGGDSVAWNGRMWVATGDDATSQGRIKYSFNGSNWSNANTTTFSSPARGVAWGNGRWVVAGGDAGGAANSIMTSTDGSNWSFATNTTGASAGSPAYNGSYWLMGATGVNSNAILYSSNALTWNRVESTAFTTGCYQLGWNGSYWVALGEGGATIQTSQNGMVWTPATSGLFGNFGESIVWNGSFWLAGGYDISNPNAAVKISRDGLNWTNTVFGVIPYVGSANGLAYTNQLGADITTQEMNIYSQNIPNVLQSTNQIVALTSSLVLNNTLYVNRPANYVGINASIPQAPLHVVGGINGQTSQIMLQTVGSTLNTSLYISTNVGQATLGVVGPSNGFMTGSVPGDTVLTTARTTNRLVMGNGTQIGLFISSGTVVVPGTLSIGGSISTASISTGSASFNNITVASSTLVSTLFFTGDVSIQAATDKIRMGSNAGITGQGQGAIAIGAAAGQTTQGANSIAIGSLAGQTSQHANTIVLNASGTALNSGTTNATYVAPIRNDQGITGDRLFAYYNQTTKEITTGPTTNLVLSSLTISGSVAFAGVSTNTLSTTTVNTANLNATTISTTNLQAIQVSSISVYASNMGIRTTTPQYTLDVNGQVWARSTLYLGQSATGSEIRFNGTTDDDPGQFTHTVISERIYEATQKSELLLFKGNDVPGVAGPDRVRVLTSGAFQVDCGGVMSWNQGGGAPPVATYSNALYVNGTNGFVGVGTGSPTVNLDVAGAARASSEFLCGTTNGYLRVIGAGGDLYIQGGSNSIVNSGTKIRFGQIGNEITTMTVDSFNQRVGIGTTSPTNGKLQVTTALGEYGFSHTDGTTIVMASYIAGTGAWFGTRTNTPLNFYVNDGQSALCVNSNNNVGIRIANPAYTLDVAGAINTTCGVLISSFSDNNPLIKLETGTADGFIGNFTVGESGPCYSVNYYLDTNTQISTIPNSGRATGMIKLAGAVSGMQFFTGGINQAPIERMRITQGGNVGIRTDNPLNDFDVNGRTYLRSTLYLGSSATGSEIRFYGTTSDSPASFINTVIAERIYDSGLGNSELILFKGNDNGSIPTAGPDRVRVLASGGFQVDAGGIYNWAQGGGEPPTATYSNALRVSGTTGNVGVGTGSPAYPLDVNGTARMATATVGGNTFYGGTFANLSYDGYQNTSNYGFMQDAVGNAYVNCFWQKKIHFRTGNQDVMFLDGEDKRIGIGTITPITPLHVQAALPLSEPYAHLLLEGTAATPNSALVFSNSTGWARIGVSGGTNQYATGSAIGDLVFTTQTANKKMMFVNFSGTGLVLSNNTVGIGKIPETGFQLDLSTANARKASSASWLTGSDERIKTDIVLANSFICYSTIKAIPLKYYEWNIIDPVTQTKIKRDDKHELGFIAQEVEKVFPNAVKQSEDYGFSNFRTLDVDQVYKMHYGATQYLGEQFEKQSTMIQTLTSQVAELQQTVSTLVGRATV